MSHPKTVACLAGDGIGPELMAAATRALDGVAKLHSLEFDDLHLPFAGEGVTRSGRALPAATRAAYRGADAILVANPHEPALDGVKADLQLVWRVVGVHLGEAGDLVVVGPIDPGSNAVAIERAFACGASRRGRILAVGESTEWRETVERESTRWAGMETEQLGLGQALVRVRDEPAELDVIVTEAHLVSAVVDSAAHFAGSNASIAEAWLPDRGPGVFAPGASESDELAGFGVADPMGMLFTTSLMLAEGLKRRSASRTLERAVGNAARQSDPSSRETRSFTDAVLDLLPQARTDLEHYDGAWR